MSALLYKYQTIPSQSLGKPVTIISKKAVTINGNKAYQFIAEDGRYYFTTAQDNFPWSQQEQKILPAIWVGYVMDFDRNYVVITHCTHFGGFDNTYQDLLRDFPYQACRNLAASITFAD